MKQLREAKKHETIVDGDRLTYIYIYIYTYINYLQHRTARRNVIHSSFSPSLFSLLSHPSIPCFMPENYHNFFMKNSARQSFWSLTGIEGSFAGSQLCVAGIPDEKEKTPVGNHYYSHGSIFGMLVWASWNVELLQTKSEPKLEDWHPKSIKSFERYV